MITRLPQRLAKDTKGVAVVEYALVAALTAMLAAGAYANLGNSVVTQYDGVATSVQHVNEQ